MKQHLPDLLIISGASLTSYGAFMAWPPAGPLVGGVLLIVAGILIARNN